MSDLSPDGKWFAGQKPSPSPCYNNNYVNNTICILVTVATATLTHQCSN